ncbi:MAG: universal stress protein [Acidobacteria bacterium]|nr:MAG: universal stress protein [Acidobacteriota bacterium]
MIEIKRILCSTDFSEASRAALPLAVRIAKRMEAQLYLIHVVRELPYAAPDPNYHFEVPEYERYLTAAAEKRLDELDESVTAQGVSTVKLLMHGNVADQILEAAKNQDIDMIVMATHGETGWRHMVFGSVAEKVVRQAHCPVLTIRQPEQGERPAT